MLVTCGDGGIDEGLVENPEISCRFGFQRTVPPVEPVNAVSRGFGAPEIGKKVVVSPARQPGLAPAVIIGAHPAHIDHAVDDGGASERLAARIIDGPSAERRLRR